MENIYLKQLLYLKGISKKRKTAKKVEEKPQFQVQSDFMYLPTQTTTLDPATDTYKKLKPKYGNYTNIINNKF